MDNEKEREEFKNFILRRIMFLMEELEFEKSRLRELENGNDVIESESEDEHFYLDNISGI
jgi:hypothetical protein